MKSGNLIENNAVATGSNIIKKSVGGEKSGQMTARALDQVAKGGPVNRQFVDALQPYAEILNKILVNPMLRQRFEQMIKQLGNEVPTESVNEEKNCGCNQDPCITNGKVNEAMSDAYGVIDAEPEVEGSVEFKQHKNTDKGSVSIEASGDDMQELARVLKLAGLTLPKDMNPEEPEAHDEPEAEEPVHIEVPSDDEPCGDEPCDEPCDDCSDDDVSYSTDKEVLTNYLKDKLAKSLS